MRVMRHSITPTRSLGTESSRSLVRDTWVPAVGRSSRSAARGGMLPDREKPEVSFRKTSTTRLLFFSWAVETKSSRRIRITRHRLIKSLAFSLLRSPSSRSCSSRSERRRDALKQPHLAKEHRRPAAQTAARAREAYGQAAVGFQTNHGQADESVDFVRAAQATRSLFLPRAIMPRGNRRTQCEMSTVISAVETLISNPKVRSPDCGLRDSGWNASERIHSKRRLSQARRVQSAQPGIT